MSYIEKVNVGGTEYNIKDGGAIRSLTVGNTTTGAAGTNASVNNSGTPQNPVLNFTIPRGADGQDAVNPFKGWWPDLATLKAAITAQPGDSANVKDASPATTWSIYVYDADAVTDNYWADSGTDADTSHVQTFASGQEVNEVEIKDDLKTDDPDDVLSARQGFVVGTRIVASNAVQEKVTVTPGMIRTGYYVRVNWSGSTPPGGLLASSGYNVTSISLSPETTYVRFNGAPLSSAAYGFYDAQDNCLFVSALASSLQEYVVKVPANSAVLKVTSKKSSSSGPQLPQEDFYCYEIKGVVLGDRPIFSEEGRAIEVAKADAVTKLIAMLGGIQDVSVSPLSFSMDLKGRWDTSLNSGAGGLTTAGTTNSSSYIDIEGYDAIMFLAYNYQSATNYGYAFLDQNNVVIDQYKYKVDDSLTTSTSLSVYFVEVKDAWRKLVAKTNTASPFFCYGVKGKNIKTIISEMQEDIIGEITDILNLVSRDYVKLSPTTSVKGYRVSGGVGDPINKTNVANSITYQVYEVESGKEYQIKGAYPTSISTYLLYWTDENDIVLRSELKGTYGEVDTWDETLTAPTGAAKLYLNAYTSYIAKGYYSVAYAEISYIDVGELEKQVNQNTLAIEELQSSVMGSNKLMKVTFDEDMNVVARSSFNDDNDIAITLYCQRNTYTGNDEPKNITFDSVYIGSKNLTDTQLCVSANEVHHLTDSVSPLDSNFGAIYAQHGYRIAKFTTTHSLTSSDLNSQWVDQNGHLFRIGKIESGAIYIVPEVTITEGVATPSFNFWGDDPMPTTLTRVGTSQTLSGTPSRYDLPIQEIISTRYIVDGVERPAGTYYCDNFCVSQEIACKKPYGLANASDWFANPIQYAGDVLKMYRSFNFKGSSCLINTILDFVEKFGVNLYRAVQPQPPTNKTGYTSRTYIPKVKKESFDYGFVTSDKRGKIVRRNDTELYDTNVFPERAITILTNNTTGQPDKLGFASGLSLNEGLITPENALDLGQVGDNGICLNLLSSDDKVYFRYFKALGDHTSDGWNTGVINTNFVHKATSYFVWYDNNINPSQQVYFVKENNSIIVYCHTQTLTGKVAVNLPGFTEGMKVEEVLEHTDGAINLTDTVVDGKLIMNYQPNLNGQANYIVLRLQ